VPAPERSRNGPGTSKRSADRSRRSAAFSFKSSPSHRMANARDRWPARTGSPVRRHPRQRNVAQRSPSSPSADGRLFHRDPLWAARKRPPLLERPPAIKIGGLESEPCGTGSRQIHGHEEVRHKGTDAATGRCDQLTRSAEPGQQRTEPASVGEREKPRSYKTGPRYACFFVTVNFRRARLPDSVSRVAIEFASRTWDNWKVSWQHWIGHNARQWKAFPAR
jgi:hypothetical protein